MAQQKTSSIPQVKAALVALFTSTLATASTDPVGTPVRVFYGDPAEATREHVIVGETFLPDQQSWSVLGQARRDEDYALAVWVETSEWKTQQESTERAFALLALLETALRANLTLGLQTTFRSITVEVAQVQLEEAAQAAGRGFFTRLSWSIRAKVQI